MVRRIVDVGCRNSRSCKKRFTVHCSRFTDIDNRTQDTGHWSLAGPSSASWPFFKSRVCSVNPVKGFFPNDEKVTISEETSSRGTPNLVKEERGWGKGLKALIVISTETARKAL